MPTASFQLTSVAGTPKRLSDAALVGATPLGTVDAATDVPYRQINIVASGAVTLGSTSGNAAQGLPIAANGTVVFGPYREGPLKLSEFWVVGAATISIFGIPF